MKLFVDDIRNPPDTTWAVARDYETALLFLMNHQIDVLSLDHDLGGVKTGYDIIKWVEKQVHMNKKYHPPIDIRVHSANPVGRDNILRAIDSINRLNQ